MKLPLLAGYTFHAQAKTIDFSGVAGFDVRQVLLIVNLSARQEIYALSEPGLGADVAPGSVLALDCDTRDMDDADTLFVVYEDGINHLPPDAATDSRLELIRLLIAGSTVTADVSGDLSAGVSTLGVAANLTRKFVEITNTGPEPLTYRWGGAASAKVGHILSPGQSARYDSKVPTANLNLFSANGTSFFVTTG